MNVLLVVKSDGTEIHQPDLGTEVNSGDAVYIGSDALMKEYSNLLQENADTVTQLKDMVKERYGGKEIEIARKQIDSEARMLVHEYNKTPDDDELLVAYLLPGEYRKRMETIQKDKDKILNRSDMIKVENTLMTA